MGSVGPARQRPRAPGKDRLDLDVDRETADGGDGFLHRPVESGAGSGMRTGSGSGTGSGTTSGSGSTEGSKIGAGSGTGNDAGSISITRLGRPMSTAVLRWRSTVSRPPATRLVAERTPPRPFRARPFGNLYAGARR